MVGINKGEYDIYRTGPFGLLPNYYFSFEESSQLADVLVY